MPSDIESPPLVYKICPRAAWETARRDGQLGGSADDARDGFIHFSAPHQLAATAARHFRGQADLVLVGVDAAALGPALKWEPSRGGELFPHLYAALPVSAVRSVIALPLGEDGVPRIPEPSA